MFKQYTKKFKRQQASTIDPDTCTFTNEEMMRCHFGALFTPVTQCHIGRPVRPHSLFTKTSYNSRLGGLCHDQSSVIDPETDSDIVHRCLLMEGGHVRWAQTHLPENWLVFDICILNPDVGDRDRTPKIGHRSSGRCRWPYKVGPRVFLR